MIGSVSDQGAEPMPSDVRPGLPDVPPSRCFANRNEPQRTPSQFETFTKIQPPDIGIGHQFFG